MQEIKQDDAEKVGGGLKLPGDPFPYPFPGDPFPFPGPVPGPNPSPWPVFDEPLSDSTTV
jgi:hypothetical protein